MEWAAHAVLRLPEAIRPSRVPDHERRLFVVHELHRPALHALVALPFVVDENDRAARRRALRGVGPPAPQPPVRRKHKVVSAVVRVAAGHVARLEEQERRLGIPAGPCRHQPTVVGEIGERLVVFLAELDKAPEAVIGIVLVLVLDRIRRKQKVPVLGRICRADIVPSRDFPPIEKLIITRDIDPVDNRAVRIGVLENNFLGRLRDLAFERKVLSPREHHPQHKLAVEISAPLGADQRLTIHQHRRQPLRPVRALREPLERRAVVVEPEVDPLLHSQHAALERGFVEAFLALDRVEHRHEVHVQDHPVGGARQRGDLVQPDEGLVARDVADKGADHRALLVGHELVHPVVGETDGIGP
mmetsp:Transcript_7213/g.17677  ORF Transcript_7213/g.17677 Transcript_7213/m.17677 type:complete len:358 (-) Transcript_7213:1050-2123(-)